MNTIQKFEERQTSALKEKRSVPSFKPGDTVRVNVRVVEGTRERIQAFEGIVISKHLDSAKIDSTVTVRKMFQGGGTEKVFLLNSPWIKSIEVLSSSIVRRSKLYYLRERTGKSARLKRRL